MTQNESTEHSKAVRTVLLGLCEDLCSALGGSGCVVSRVVGDLLVGLVESARDSRRLQLGHGYLISDYPLTREVLEQREPRMVSLNEPNPEENEAQLLRELGFDSLLMLPLVVSDELWALVEIYGKGDRTFDDEDVAKAEPLLERASDALLATR